jgi:hypothetical protein
MPAGSKARGGSTLCGRAGRVGAPARMQGIEHGRRRPPVDSAEARSGVCFVGLGREGAVDFSAAWSASSRGCPTCAGQDLWPRVEERWITEGIRTGREVKRLWCQSRGLSQSDSIVGWFSMWYGLGHGRKKVTTLGPSGLPWEQAYVRQGRRNLGPSLPKKKYETLDTNQ